MTETILFVCLFFLLFSVHSLFLLLSGEAFSPFFYFICAVSWIRHIRSGCLACFSFFVVLIIFDLHYIHPTICVFLSNNLWSFCCLPGTCYFFFPLFFYISFCPVFSPRGIRLFMCRAVWDGTAWFVWFTLISKREPSTLHHHPHCLRMIFPIYLQSLIWIDPISQGLYSSLPS